MPRADVLAYAAQFIGGTEDATDLMQDVEDFLKGELSPENGSVKALNAYVKQLDELTPLVTEVVSKALSEVSAMLALKAQRMMEDRAAQERRVAAVVRQFDLNRGGDSPDVSPELLKTMTDALYGVNGVQGV